MPSSRGQGGILARASREGEVATGSTRSPLSVCLLVCLLYFFFLHRLPAYLVHPVLVFLLLLLRRRRRRSCRTASRAPHHRRISFESPPRPPETNRLPPLLGSQPPRSRLVAHQTLGGLSLLPFGRHGADLSHDSVGEELAPPRGGGGGADGGFREGGVHAKRKHAVIFRRRRPRRIVKRTYPRRRRRVACCVSSPSTRMAKRGVFFWLPSNSYGRVLNTKHFFL